MSRTKTAHFSSIVTPIVLALIFAFLFMMATPAPVFAKEIQPPPTTTIIIKSEERSFTSCQFTYTGDNAETCSGYNGYPCTCTINCPSCLTEENTCTGLSVNVINAICGNSGWQEADRMAEWHFYTVEKRITQYIAGW